MSALSLSLKAEDLFSVGNIHITNTLFTSWVVLYLLCVVAIMFPKKLHLVPNKIQNIIEYPFEAMANFCESIAGEKYRVFFPWFATFFIFILACNLIAFVPGVGTIGIKEGDKLLPLFRAPTSDLNTPIAMAIISVIAVQYYGIKFQGRKYLSKFFTIKNPMATFVGLLELLSEFAKLISFSFRLFGNVFAGEALLIVLAYLVPFFVHEPFYLLEGVVGIVQAFVFATLTLVFLNMATESEHV